ncbi:hypothetical protein [uncultured Sphingobium sp.]|uniref:hypothetical protein n=1 Tax=uncultured Sphingobium sp. TaxID=316087 RepID=UPI00259BC948|nr:hypothetical protein [uncultured Sphingobium sp.]
MARQFASRPEQLPIPEDAKPHRTWPPLMLDMAAHIGAYATLRLIDAFAGQYIYVPLDPARSPFTDVVGTDKAAVLAHVYGRERLPIPAGRNALVRARRAGMIALVRTNRMTVSEAAARLRMPVRHLSTLINNSDEGTDAEPLLLLERPRDARQLDMFE